jgi:hypothetical protein
MILHPKPRRVVLTDSIADQQLADLPLDITPGGGINT